MWKRKDDKRGRKKGLQGKMIPKNILFNIISEILSTFCIGAASSFSAYPFCCFVMKHSLLFRGGNKIVHC
jgi:hypothetical protein